MEEQMGQYARDLERETNQEKEKFEKNFEALSKRKDDIIKSKRDKMKVHWVYPFCAIHNNYVSQLILLILS